MSNSVNLFELIGVVIIS